MNPAVVIFCFLFTAWSEKLLDIENLWSQHKVKHGLKYDAEENEERRAIFVDNMRFVEEYNSKNNGVKLAMNRFGHLRESEINFGLRMNLSHWSNTATHTIASNLPIKSSVDWRKSGVVTRVKNQGECGSCYAFSAVGAIESHHAIRTGSLEELSEQEVIDCSNEHPNSGCSGGLPNSVFKYSMKHGLCLKNDYPYNASDNKCIARSKIHVERLLSFVKIPKHDEKEMVRVLSFVGPVSVCFNAESREFIFYKSGILDIKGCGASFINHAVLAVGYNTEHSKPYLIVKNSWGHIWGENGYFRIVLYKNMCGISNLASYPILKQ